MDGGVDGGHDGIVAGQEAGTEGMRCPSCGFHIETQGHRAGCPERVAP